MVKVILNGCSGKMGSVISNLAETKFPNVEIVANIFLSIIHNKE